MKKLVIGTLAVSLMMVPVTSASARVPAPVVVPGPAHEFVVLYTEGASLDAAHAAIAAAGGTIIKENTAVGLATVTTSNAVFVAAAGTSAAIDGVAPNDSIGQAPKDTPIAPSKIDIERAGRDAADLAAAEAATAASAGARTNPLVAAIAAGYGKHAITPEPLAPLQWDMQQIGATATGSYKYEQGSRKVLVGIIDTGVDGTHPDIAPNFSESLSRNFTTDMPDIDGPCEHTSCVDPANEDDDGHGTHVASTIGSPINGLGIAGVAPNVTIVNIRAGQDSGYFFLQPSVDALTYAGDIGVDVVNMSYYVDPWLFNCTSNPADTPEEQAEQATIIKAMQRALTYARRHGVTLVAAAGNGATDYTKVLEDDSSPDYGPLPHDRTDLDPATCISMPSEGVGVISVSSTGPSTRKAYYSDYGNGYVDVAAPGGDAYDTPDGTLSYPALVLAAYPTSLAIANGEIDADGVPTVPYVVEDCESGVCAYYQYLQGTSMASPHATGVAALIVSHYGYRDRVHGGLTLPPSIVEVILRRSATKTPCPVPADYVYTLNRASGTTVDTHTCEGTTYRNGFYGNGIINALRAVRWW